MQVVQQKMQLIQELLDQPFMSPQLMQLSMVCGGNHGKIRVRLSYPSDFIIDFEAEGRPLGEDRAVTACPSPVLSARAKSATFCSSGAAFFQKTATLFRPGAALSPGKKPSFSRCRAKLCERENRAEPCHCARQRW